jgi:hypothetical protein
MPAAFSYGKNGAKDNEFRADLIERAQDNEVLDMLITFIKSRLENIK